MMRLTIRDILNAVGGRLISGHEGAFANGVSTDSRTIRRGELFFALKGPRFDGHKFIDDVVKKGAAGAVVSAEVRGLPLQAVSRGQEPGSGSSSTQFGIIHVEDTLKALGDLSAYWRKTHPVPLIAVSGSCGKTTTKEMIASILNTSRCILKTEGNLNNLIGLPLTLFGLNNIHKAAVVELGISMKGEMKRLAEICKPNVAVLTNIGEAHTATLGSIEGVAAAKGELFQGMGTDGTAIINIDDPWLLKIANNFTAKKVTFSLKSEADVMLKDYSLDNAKGMSATFIVMGKEILVRLKYAGIHNLSNAAAAIAATFPLVVAKEEIIEGLYSAEPIPGRTEIISAASGITIIDDTYNANPLSMEASLKTLSSVVGGGRKIAVLGDMLELGDIAQDAHRKIGRLVREAGIDIFFAMGSFSKDFARGAIEAGMSPERINVATDKTSLIKGLKNIIRQGDVILIKGSRVTAMEEVVEELKIAK